MNCVLSIKIKREFFTYLEIKYIELLNGIVYIYQTDVANEFLAIYESEKVINFLFWM